MARILKLPQVIEVTGLARSSIYLKVSEKSFPKPILLGSRAVGWLEHEVEEWIEKCIETSRSKKGAGV